MIDLIVVPDSEICEILLGRNHLILGGSHGWESLFEVGYVVLSGVLAKVGWVALFVGSL